jgi:hypothetical protein
MLIINIDNLKDMNNIMNNHILNNRDSIIMNNQGNNQDMNNRDINQHIIKLQHIDHQLLLIEVVEDFMEEEDNIKKLIF